MVETQFPDFSKNGPISPIFTGFSKIGSKNFSKKFSNFFFGKKNSIFFFEIFTFTKILKYLQKATSLTFRMHVIIITKKSNRRTFRIDCHKQKTGALRGGYAAQDCNVLLERKTTPLFKTIDNFFYITSIYVSLPWNCFLNSSKKLRKRISSNFSISPVNFVLIKEQSTFKRAMLEKGWYAIIDLQHILQVSVLYISNAIFSLIALLSLYLTCI